MHRLKQKMFNVFLGHYHYEVLKNMNKLQGNITRCSTITFFGEVVVFYTILEFAQPTLDPENLFLSEISEKNS